MPIWGGSANTEAKPQYKWLTNGLGNTANVFATERGWVHRWPWGDEVIIAIGGLDTNLGVPDLAEVDFSTDPVVNATAQTLKVTLQYNEAVSVTGTPTVVAISSQLSPANATLTYSSADSDPDGGKLVFQNTNVNLAQANAVGATYTVNSTSVLTGFSGITDARTGNAVANSVSLSGSVTVEANA